MKIFHQMELDSHIPPQNADNLEQRDPIESVNAIGLLKKPQQFKQAFFSMMSISQQNLKLKNYERAAQALTKAADMLDIGKNILKEINRFWRIIVYANLACCFHYTRKLAKCNKFCQKIIQQLDKVVADNTEKEFYLKISRILIKLRFQHCAILSQLQQHDKAFEVCKTTLPILHKCIEFLLAYVQQNQMSILEKKNTSETVQFSRQVFKFAKNILEDLYKNINEPLNGQERQSFYFWQKNPEKNEEQVKKKFIPSTLENNSCKRSILGVSKTSHWIDQFNIGNIMHFSQMKISDFQNNVPMQEYIFKDKLYELVIYCSLSHFTIATEMRLIQSGQQQKKQKSTVPTQNMNLMKKYGYEQRSELFRLSQLHHLKAIDIMAKNIKTTVPYITHIIRSYEKHYIKQKKVLEPIVAICQESMISMNESIIQEINAADQYAYYENKQEEVQNQTPYATEKDPKYTQCQLKYSSLTASALNQYKQGKIPISLVPNLKVQEIINKEFLRNKDTMKEQMNNSGEQYLKSQRQKSSNKMTLKKVKSQSKMKDLKKVKSKSKINDSQKMLKLSDRLRSQENDIRQKSQYGFPKTKEKTKKPEKKQQKSKPFMQFSNDKYGQKQIKIKTQSCTHIKVFYKKKK